jgi:hypothetical protein
MIRSVAYMNLMFVKEKTLRNVVYSAEQHILTHYGIKASPHIKQRLKIIWCSVQGRSLKLPHRQYGQGRQNFVIIYGYCYSYVKPNSDYFQVFNFVFMAVFKMLTIKSELQKWARMTIVFAKVGRRNPKQPTTRQLTFLLLNNNRTMETIYSVATFHVHSLATSWSWR